MFRRFVSFLCLVALVFFISLLSTSSQQDTQELQLKNIKSAQDLVNQIESLCSRIQSRKIITSEDVTKLDRLLDDYPARMNAADEESTESPEGQKIFRDVLLVHQKQWKNVIDKIEAIQREGKEANIIFDRPVLERMHPEEFQGYKNFLSSTGRSKMEKMYPVLFKNDRNPDSYLDPLEVYPTFSQGFSLGMITAYIFSFSVSASSASPGCYSTWQNCKDDCIKHNFNYLDRWKCRAWCFWEYLKCKLS
jgi:hypothetical protein